MQTADRVRQILSTRGLTLYQVSQRSAELFGPSSPYYIPQRLYQELAIGALSPNIHQLIAFSRVTNYRLCDWLAVFGFRLDDIPRFQLQIARRRTVLLDSSIYDEDQWIPWFVERLSESSLPGIAPLAQVLKLGPSRRASELLALNKRRFLYAKVGSENTFAYPDLMPEASPELTCVVRLTRCLRLDRVPARAYFLSRMVSFFTVATCEVWAKTESSFVQHIFRSYRLN